MTNTHAEAHRHLLKVSTKYHQDIEALIRRNGRLEVIAYDSKSLLIFLARTVVGQQLSAKAARSIWAKIENELRAGNMTLATLFQARYAKKLKKCGVSGNKIKALIGLQEALKVGSIEGSQILNSSYSEIKNKVTALWGFGEWSADMCAMFYCGLPDVYPSTDAAIRQGLHRLCGDDQAPHEIAAFYSPYRTYLCRHIWLGLDSGYLD